MSPLDVAVARLNESAKAYDDALAKNGAALSPTARQLQSLMQTIDQTLRRMSACRARLVQEPRLCAGTVTGYGAKTLPGVREAIEDERWDDAVRYAKLTADALNAYSDRLDQAVAVVNGG